VITHIDVGAVLRGSVSNLYSNLVTRHTGRAVRDGIERALADVPGRRVTVIDFSHVGILDYSCADEIVAKLLLRRMDEAAACPDAYFVFRGVGDHLDPIEHVLMHHGLAIIVELPDGETYLIGQASDAERLVWHTLKRLREAVSARIADAAGLPDEACDRALATLWQRRLVLREGERWHAIVGGVA
jgi:hypothetical protein